jgi:hypothetical protein
MSDTTTAAYDPSAAGYRDTSPSEWGGIAGHRSLALSGRASVRKEQSR